MNGDSNVPARPVPDDSGFYRRYYNLRSSNNGAAAGTATTYDPPAQVHAGQRKQPTGGFCAPRGSWSAGVGVGGIGQRPAARTGAWPAWPRVASGPLGRLVLTLALAATLVLSLGMSGMYVNIRLLHRQLSDLSVAVDGTVSKMAEIKRKQEALYGQLYEHVNRAQEKLWADLEALLQRELWLRDNDKTGLVDFALESAGGRVISTNDTPRYDAEDATLSFLGIPLYQSTRSNPAAMLQPDMSPGSCWAFRGGRGVAVVSLLGFVHVSAVSLEHIPASQAPTGPTLSAPRDFAILALPKPALDEEAVELGRFVYRTDGRALQIFRIPVRSDRSYRYVALRIDSNHGHPDFTCVYRFRVHGSLDHRSQRVARVEDRLVERQDDPGVVEREEHKSL